MKSVFRYQSYKKFLKDVLAEHGRGAISKLAAAADCNRTYLSQCLTSKVQLTPDHIFGISVYLNFTEDEQSYILYLLLHERSASKKIQAALKEKMDKLAQADLVLTNKIQKKEDSSELTEAQKTAYYASWKHAAIHTLTSIKEYQQVQSLAEKARMSESEVLVILKNLTEMGLITSQNGKWSHTGKNIHVPSGSAHTSLNHLNWRLKSIDDVNNKASVHYTTLFSLSKKDWTTLRDQVLSFIATQRDFVHGSGAEEMYCFCCDLFQVGE